MTTTPTIFVKVIDLTTLGTRWAATFEQPWARSVEYTPLPQPLWSHANAMSPEEGATWREALARWVRSWLERVQDETLIEVEIIRGVRHYLFEKFRDRAQQAQFVNDNLTPRPTVR